MNPILRTIKNRGERALGNTLRLTENVGTLPEDLEKCADLTYPACDGAALAADLYWSKDCGDGPMRVAIMVHGGGLFSGSRHTNRAFCEILARKGFLVLAPEYRLLDAADGFGEIADISAGLAFLGRRLAEFRGDPQQVYLFGESAGAWLSVYAAAAMENAHLRRLFGCPEPTLSLRGLIGISGMYYTTRLDPLGLVYRKDLYGERRRRPSVMELMNPEHPAVVSALPPVLLTSSGSDFLKSYTLRYAEALQTQGHSCELLYYPKGKDLTHAFPTLRPELSESKAALERILDWMQKLR